MADDQLRQRTEEAYRAVVHGLAPIFNQVTLERIRQDTKFGADRHHSAAFWLAILTEEVGEAASEVCEENNERLREELVQVAAVAVAIVEWIDRGAPTDGIQ